MKEEKERVKEGRRGGGGEQGSLKAYNLSKGCHAFC